MYSFITLTKTSLPATPEFGTCSDIIRVTSELKSAVTVEMVGFRGLLESAADRGKRGWRKRFFGMRPGWLPKKGNQLISFKLGHVELSTTYVVIKKRFDADINYEQWI